VKGISQKKLEMEIIGKIQHFQQMVEPYISILNFLPKVCFHLRNVDLFPGALPPSSLSWFRICQRGIEQCFEPTLFFANESSCIITQGALGDTYFANALRSMISLDHFVFLFLDSFIVLASDPKYISRLFLSTKYAHMGLYTIKFCKQGKVLSSPLDLILSFFHLTSSLLPFLQVEICSY
jgi:hypothetical protein